MKELSEKTPIRLGLVISIGAACIWIGALQKEVSAHSEAIKDLQTQQAQYVQVVYNIGKDISEIKGELRSSANQQRGLADEGQLKGE